MKLTLAAVITLALAANTQAAIILYEDEAQFLAAAPPIVAYDDFETPAGGIQYNTMIITRGDVTYSTNGCSAWCWEVADHWLPGNTQTLVQYYGYIKNHLTFDGSVAAAGMVLQMSGQLGSSIQAEVFETDGNRWIETLQTWTPEAGDAPHFFGWTSDVGIERISLLSNGDGTRPPIWIDDVQNSAVSAVPLPTSVWLFGSGLLGLAGIARRKKA